MIEAFIFHNPTIKKNLFLDTNKRQKLIYLEVSIS